MTGIADLFILVKRPHKGESWARVSALTQNVIGYRKFDHTRFVVLSWKQTGSNLLCGILFNHPEIVMHNELFNPIDIVSYYQHSLIRNEGGDRWNVLGRDLFPDAFVDHIWQGKDFSGSNIRNSPAKAVGFKSFPDHWWEVRNDSFFDRLIMGDFRVKKIILFREDELRVYVSMKRAEITGCYMTKEYPQDLKIRIDPAAFQIFVNNYRDTFNRRYKSPWKDQDTFPVSYEQLIDEENFKTHILPLLWEFLGVDKTQPLHKLRETVKQAVPEEDLSEVIENFDELEFCFRHTDVKYFQTSSLSATVTPSNSAPETFNDEDCSWSILLPICSRTKKTDTDGDISRNNLENSKSFNSNRLNQVTTPSQYESKTEDLDAQRHQSWKLLQSFARSLEATCTEEQLRNTECIVGVDVNDPVFSSKESEDRIRDLLPCKAVFISIQHVMYGQVCRIWNHLGSKAKNDFIVLLGDDVLLQDKGWQSRIAEKFSQISTETNLPFGAACVALNDLTFPGFPTFPVVHKWHIKKFGTILPRQFVNQGGDPYLFELYSRYSAAAFATDCRLKNTIGGDGDARYPKYDINWKGQILRLSLLQMDEFIGSHRSGVCLDVVVPSYRTNNTSILSSICRLQTSTKGVYVRFWLVVDNPDEVHLAEVKSLAKTVNEHRFGVLGNYFVSVLHYGENRGASFARNFAFNYSTADWVLFLDDDVQPCSHILDAYVGALFRYPKAKVFVGSTILPTAHNTWTKMLRTCNIMFFYGISKHVTCPPWGVTANLMVHGSRHNPTIQFKTDYPRTGGGEDIDFCFQFKEWYAQEQPRNKIIVGVPGATAFHPWWNKGRTCYGQINGWAWGDSLCISKWPEKCFWAAPNWIEFIVICLPVWGAIERAPIWSILSASLVTVTVEHISLALKYYPATKRHVQSGFFYRAYVACGAGTVLSFQELTRLVAHLYRGNVHCIFRRVDWNDGKDEAVKLHTQLGSSLRFAVYTICSWFFMKSSTN